MTAGTTTPEPPRGVTSATPTDTSAAEERVTSRTVSSGSASPPTWPSPPVRPSPATSPAAPPSSPTPLTPLPISFLVVSLGCHIVLPRLPRTKNTLMVTLDLGMGILMSAPDMVNQGFEHDHSHIHGSHHHGVDLNHPVLALSMTIVSISVKEGLYWITKRAGEREGSSLMKANAWHHRADAVSSIVALIGVGGAISGVPILDPLAGIVVSGLIMKAGIESGYQSLTELVDAGVPLPVLAPIKQTILQVEGVKGCHRIRGRKAGSSIYLDAHIEVDPFLSVSAAHDIGENVRHQIQKSHNQVAEVFIHIDPSYMQCSSIVDQRENLKDPETQNLNSNSTQQDTEAIVTNTISSLFPEKMTVEHITRHLLQGKVLVEVQVSMPPEMSIRDAMDIAKEAENEILKASASINQASIQLLLGHPIPQLYRAKVNKESKHSSQN